ncbi:MAG: TolC family protein [Verrucomicrobiota bacterium]
MLHTVLCCILLTVLAHADVYYPVTLDECYQKAFIHNPDIQQARLDLERAAGTKLVFTSRAFPRAAAELKAGVSVGDLYAGAMTPIAVISAAAAQPLFDTSIPATLRRGTLEVILAEQQLHRVASEQMHAVRVAFWQTVLARELARIQREIAECIAMNVKREQERLAAGQVGKQAVRQAEIQALNLQVDLSRIEREQRATAIELALLLGESVTTGAVVRLPAPEGILAYTPLVVDVASESGRALVHRPDLCWLREMIRAIRENQSVIEAGLFPFITLASSGQYLPESVLSPHSQGVVPGRNLPKSEVLYGATWMWRVGDNGAIIGASRRVVAAREAMELTLRRLEENVPRELAMLSGATEMTTAKVTALRSSAQQAKELLQLAESRVALGEATQLDYRNAQASLLSTQTGLAQAAFEGELTRAELDRITGHYLDINLKVTP